MIFIEGDFPSGKDCKFHCSPTCHPAQVGPEWQYGCTHKAWPQNRCGDFVPLVKCDGDLSKCELKRTKFVTYYRRGKVNALNHAKKKVERLTAEISEIDRLTNKEK